MSGASRIVVTLEHDSQITGTRTTLTLLPVTPLQNPALLTEPDQQAIADGRLRALWA
jgi:hypothetical protein